MTGQEIGEIVHQFIHLPGKYLDGDFVWKPGRNHREKEVRARVFTGDWHADQFRFIAKATYIGNEPGGVSFSIFFLTVHRIIAFDMGPLERHRDGVSRELVEGPHLHFWDPVIGEAGFHLHQQPVRFDDPVEGWRGELNGFLTTCGIRSLTAQEWRSPVHEQRLRVEP